MIPRVCSPRSTALRALTLLALIGPALSGCTREAAAPWPDNVVTSQLLAPSVRESLDLLQNPGAGNPEVIADLLLYDEIRQGICDRRTRAAATLQLHVAWSSTPAHPLWPELAIQQWRSFEDYQLVFETYDSPVCTDTTTAVGIYASTWRAMDHASMVSNFNLALERSAGLDPFFQFWIALSSAYASSILGDHERSLTENLALLPTARALGGPRLESIVWLRIVRARMDQGDLDDALIAATLADTLATLAGGPTIGVVDARLARAKVLATRGDSQKAFFQYESSIRTATESGLVTSAGETLNAAGTLADAVGEPTLALEYDLRGLRLALSNADSFSVPAHMANIANGYRLMGALDSCRAYLSRAEMWVHADPYPYNVARLALSQTRYYAQIGAYDVVDSLLEAAQALHEQFSSREERAELYIELIQGWMRSGRPDLVYRLIDVASELRSGVADTHADRNVSADLNLLIGEFYTRRGQFALADESLVLAATALEDRPDPEKAWTLARNRGLLDRARGNLRGAEVSFRNCVQIGEQLGYPDLAATGRVFAQSVRLEMGDFADARVTFPAEELESSLDTRILALLLTGVSHLREGDPQIAHRYLTKAHEACRSWTPLDLIGRVELEIGRAYAAMGDPDAALERYEQIAARILGADHQSDHTEQLAYFNGDLRRDLVEARLGIEPVDARAGLAFAVALLPRWTGTHGDLRTPQIIYFVGKTLSGRWTVSESGLSWSSLPGSGEIRARLAPVVADMSKPGTTVSEAELAALSEMLLGDLESIWPTGETLHIVPDLDLFEVPWAGLELPSTHTSKTSMIDYGSLVVLDRPATDAAAIRSTGNRLLLIAADHSEASGLERLRNAEREVEDVAAVWPTGKADIRVGASAAGSLSPGADLSPYRAIHIASHALVYSGRADQTTLLLEESSPTASAIGELQIAAELVFLSACEAGDGGGTRSVHAGLARSFQDAGAAQVIAPISVIDDAAARELAVDFYQNWSPGVSVAEALRAAQLEQRKGEHSHPFYWAFYEVFGAAGSD